MEIVLTYIPIKCGIVKPDVNIRLNNPTHNLIVCGIESYLTPLTLKLIMPMGMHTKYTLMGMLSPFQSIGLCIET